MNFNRVSNEEGDGTSLQGKYTASYSALVRAFGEPPEPSGDDKTTAEWVFAGPNGEITTLYDYKATNLYSGELPSVEEFRKQTSYTWHIGAETESIVPEFKRWLDLQLQQEGIV